MCVKSARWWDSEVKDKISSRRNLYKRMLHDNKDDGKIIVSCGRR